MGWNRRYAIASYLRSGQQPSLIMLLHHRSPSLSLRSAVCLLRFKSPAVNCRRIIATTILRGKAVRRSVAVFIYALLLAATVQARVDTIPHFLISITDILELISVVVFMFLIDHAARLLRPVTIVSIIAQQESGRELPIHRAERPRPGVTVPARLAAWPNSRHPRAPRIYPDRKA
jgi:hypothetical protein